MPLYLATSGAEDASGIYVPMVLVSAFAFLFAWYHILQSHRKQPLSRKLMAALIAYTAFAAAMLPLGLLSAVFFDTFFFLGIPLLLNISPLCNRLRGQRCSAYTEGTVTDIRRVRHKITHGGFGGFYYNYYPTVTFYVNEERYTVELAAPCESDAVGNTWWIRYNPNDPNEITQEEYETGLNKLMLIAGVIFLCIALISFIIGIVSIAR